MTKFTDDRPFAKPKAAARKLVEDRQCRRAGPGGPLRASYCEQNSVMNTAPALPLPPAALAAIAPDMPLP